MHILPCRVSQISAVIVPVPFFGKTASYVYDPYLHSLLSSRWRRQKIIVFSCIAGHQIIVDAASIGILTFIFSVLYRSILVPDWISFFWYRTGSGIGTSFHSGNGLIGCRKPWHSSILKNCMKGGRLSWYTHKTSSYIHCKKS
jgi:hypothetical protein